MTTAIERRGGKRPGAGRPRLSPDEETIEVNVGMPASMVERLDELGPTRAAAVRRIVEQYLRRRAKRTGG